MFYWNQSDSWSFFNKIYTVKKVENEYPEGKYKECSKENMYKIMIFDFFCQILFTTINIPHPDLGISKLSREGGRCSVKATVPLKKSLQLYDFKIQKNHQIVEI